MKTLKKIRGSVLNKEKSKCHLINEDMMNNYKDFYLYNDLT